MENITTTESSPIETRLSALERSAGRWRLLAVSSTTLIAGLLIGGMSAGMSADSQPDTANNEEPQVVGITATSQNIYRVYEDGSMSYIKVNNPHRTAQGIYSWGDVLIDEKYKNPDLR